MRSIVYDQHLVQGGIFMLFSNLNTPGVIGCTVFEALRQQF